MNDVDLIRKLEEINECKQQSIDLIKQNIGIINEIIYNSLDPGILFSEQNTMNLPNIMNPSRAVIWCSMCNIRYVFLLEIIFILISHVKIVQLT